MRIQSTTRYAALAAFVGALACAGNKARTDETTPDQAAAARDTTSGRDTTQNPPGYRGMERDTTQAPPTQPTPTDTFLQHQGQGQPQDTAGYSGMERVDTTGQAAQPGQTDTSGYRADTTSGAGVRDTTGAAADTTRSNPSSANPSGLDSTGMSRTGDTTGYSPTQQTRDSTTR